jgi:PAS domain S-box-containing protein
MRYHPPKKDVRVIKTVEALDEHSGLQEVSKEEHLLLEQAIFQLNMKDGVSIQEVADHLLKGIERLYPGAMCSILRLREDNTLWHFSAPHLPEEYMESINGTKAGPLAGSCGRAASTDKTVVVSDIETDPIWKDFRAVAATFALKACWSVPIHYSTGKVLGAFAIYYHHAARPSRTMMQYIERWATLIGMLLENHEMVDNLYLNQVKLQKSEIQYRYLFHRNPMPMWIFDLATYRFLEVNETAIKHYGFSAEEFSRMTIFDIRPTTEHARVRSIAENEKEENTQYDRGLWRHQKKNGEVIFVEIFSHLLEYEGKRAMLVLAQDITKNIQLQEQLLKEKSTRQQQIMKANILMQEKARKDIGYELHDNVNQLLGAAKLYIESIAPIEGEFEEYRQEGIKLIRFAIEEIRSLTKTLVPPRLADVGLANSVKDLIANIEKTQPIRISFKCKLDEKFIDNNIKLAAYRIIQEQTSNILKYASATKITIDIRQDNQGLSLTVFDNGVGFEPSQKRDGIGFTNIMNRALMYNGRVKIDSSPGKGCTLFVFLSLE